jgi:PIN domain nuclease of toxin-antitoxin system
VGNGHAGLSASQRHILQTYEPIGLGVSVISCWEVAKLVERNRLLLNCRVEDWVRQALQYPGVRLLELTPEIAVASTQLPQPFHRDPADQIIVATARLHNIPLLTADARLLRYPYILTLP